MNNSTVLVVDDEAHVRAFADEVLTQAGFTVLLAEGGAEALAILNAVHIDVMVSDILMPRPDFWDLSEELTRITAGPETIVITGCGTEILHEEAKRRGATTVLQKPFAVRALVQAVTEAANRASMRKTAVSAGANLRPDAGSHRSRNSKASR